MQSVRSCGASLVLCAAFVLACSSSGSQRPTVPSSDRDILALKPAGTNALIVHAIGYGTGTIAISDPSQTCVTYEWGETAIHYSQVCWAYVPIANPSVTVTAAANDGSQFTGWGAPCAGSTDDTCAVPMDADRNINIGFWPKPPDPRTEYVLNVDVLGFVDGDISAPPGLGLVCQRYDNSEDVVSLRYARTCTAHVPNTTPPTEVTLTATPTVPGAQFAGWGGSCGGTGTCTVTMDRDRGVTAGFTRGPAACAAPFVPSGAGTGCVCPAGYHPEGGTCAADLVPDTASPFVFLTSPLEGDTLSGDFVVTASVVDDRGVGAVILVVDGAQTPYQLTLGPSGAYGTPVIDSTMIGAGSHALQVCATDTSGNIACSAVITATVAGPAQPSAAWSVVANPNDDPIYGFDTLYGVGGASADRVWAVGHGVILAWDGTRWTIVGGSSQPYYAIWGLSPSDFWVFSSYRQAYRCDLSTSTCTTASFPGYWSTWYLYDLVAAWGSSSDDVWAVDTYGYAIHWDGTTWVQVGAELNDRWWQNGYGTWFHDRWPLYGIWGSARSSVWAVGYNGAVVHWDGLAWSETSRPTSSHLHGIWGSSANDVWAVGTGGTILHWDGNGWSDVPSDTTSDLMAVWGASASDVWAVGANGTATHWDGAQWRSATIGPAVTLRSVWGSSPNDMWAVGDNGTILHYH